MGDTAARVKRMEMQLADTPARLSVDIETEILLCLPAKHVLRCGVVCKEWRRITTDSRFLAEHARRQPAEVVLYKYVDRAPPPPRPGPAPGRGGDHTADIVLDVLPVSGDELGRRRLIRYPKMGDWLLLASSHGVLLLRKAEGLYCLCNPTTRTWAELPRLPLRRTFFGSNLFPIYRECAFYFHLPSNQYRLLCRKNLSARGTWTWCVLSTGAAKPRRLDVRAAEDAGITKLVPCLRTTVMTPVALHGRLHWPPHKASTPVLTEMVIFDIVPEAFTKMAGPPTTTAEAVKLFDMDGLLVAADFGEARHIDLWLLEDYGAARWELRHRVTMPWGLTQRHHLLSVAAAADNEGNVILGDHHALVVYNVKSMKVKTVESVATSNNNVLVSRHVFRPNLVQHPSFKVRSSAEMQSVRF